MLQHDYAWYTLLLLKHDGAASLPGGMSQVMRSVFHSLVAGSNAIGSGVYLQSIKKMFQAKPHLIIADEAALKATFGQKGASGLMHILPQHCDCVVRATLLL